MVALHGASEIMVSCSCASAAALSRFRSHFLLSGFQPRWLVYVSGLFRCQRSSCSLARSASLDYPTIGMVISSGCLQASASCPLTFLPSALWAGWLRLQLGWAEPGVRAFEPPPRPVPTWFFVSGRSVTHTRGLTPACTERSHRRLASSPYTQPVVCNCPSRFAVRKALPPVGRDCTGPKVGAASENAP